MLDVEDKGTLTQAEFADGLLNLLTLLGLIDSAGSSAAHRRWTKMLQYSKPMSSSVGY